MNKMLLINQTVYVSLIHTESCNYLDRLMSLKLRTQKLDFCNSCDEWS